MSPPKLLHLTTVDLSLRVLLAHQLKRFAEEGYEVMGASAPGPYVAGLREDGIVHMPVPHLTREWSPVSDALALRELYSLFRRVRPDIVHTHNPKSGVLGRLAARSARVPVVVNTVHGLYANPSLPRVKRAIIGSSERWAARLSHHEFFQSEEDYRMALRTRMVRPDRASLLGNGVDLSRFDPGSIGDAAATGVRRSWGAKDGAVVVGTVGRLVREKGYLEFFEAARRARQDVPDAVFVVVGPEEPSKEDRISAADMQRAREGGIIFHGEGVEMPAIYAAFDIFVLASHREGMPRSAIEASAMSRPVIATDIRGCREVVADGETGALVPVRDPGALASAIAELAHDAAMRRSMGERGRLRALERFDEEEVVRRTLKVYGSLLSGSKR